MILAATVPTVIMHALRFFRPVPTSAEGSAAIQIALLLKEPTRPSWPRDRRQRRAWLRRFQATRRWLVTRPFESQYGSSKQGMTNPKQLGNMAVTRAAGGMACGSWRCRKGSCRVG